MVPVEAAAPAAPAAAGARSPAWTRLSARLVWVLAAALFLLGRAEAGLALSAIILPAGKACAAATPSMHTATGCLILGVCVQMLAAGTALSGPAWEVAIVGTVMGILTACYFPATDVLWLLLACDGALAFHFWFFYVVLWPVFAIGAVVSLKCEVTTHKMSSIS